MCSPLAVLLGMLSAILSLISRFLLCTSPAQRPTMVDRVQHIQDGQFVFYSIDIILRRRYESINSCFGKHVLTKMSYQDSSEEDLDTDRDTFSA